MYYIGFKYKIKNKFIYVNKLPIYLYKILYIYITLKN